MPNRRERLRSSSAALEKRSADVRRPHRIRALARPHLAARVFGNVAVVRLQPYRMAVAGTSVDRSGEFAVVDVWTKDGGAWKLSARHLSRPDTLKR